MHATENTSSKRKTDTKAEAIVDGIRGALIALEKAELDERAAVTGAIFARGLEKAALDRALAEEQARAVAQAESAEKGLQKAREALDVDRAKKAAALEKDIAASRPEEIAEGGDAFLRRDEAEMAYAQAVVREEGAARHVSDSEVLLEAARASLATGVQWDRERRLRCLARRRTMLVGLLTENDREMVATANERDPGATRAQLLASNHLAALSSPDEYISNRAHVATETVLRHCYDLLGEHDPRRHFPDGPDDMKQLLAIAGLTFGAMCERARDAVKVREAERKQMREEADAEIKNQSRYAELVRLREEKCSRIEAGETLTLSVAQRSEAEGDRRDVEAIDRELAELKGKIDPAWLAANFRFQPRAVVGPRTR